MKPCVDLVGVLEGGTQWEPMLRVLGASYAGLRGLLALVGSCRAVWARRAEIEGAVMGGQPWGGGLQGAALRAAARQRLCWAHLRATHHFVGVGEGWHSAYAFAVGPCGYAVFGHAPGLAGAAVWLKGPGGAAWCEVVGCNHGHELALIGQWVAVSFELRTGGQAFRLYDGQLAPVFEGGTRPGSGPLRVCTGSFDGQDYLGVCGWEECLLLRLGAHGVAPRQVWSPARVLGGVFLGGALYLVAEGGLWAVPLGGGECRRVCRGGRFTGAACALEPRPGRRGLVLMTQDDGVVWWGEGSHRLHRLCPAARGPGEECSLAALDARRFALVGRGGRVRVVCSASWVLEDDFQAVWSPPRQISVVAAPDGRACVAVLKPDCTLAVLGPPELCHLP
jgi:hypothetical protein